MSTDEEQDRGDSREVEIRGSFRKTLDTYFGRLYY